MFLMAESQTKDFDTGFILLISTNNHKMRGGLIIFLLCFSVVSGFHNTFGSSGLISHSGKISMPRTFIRSTSAPISECSVPSIKARLQSDMKTAMLAKQKDRVAAIRSVQSAIKQKEVDDKIGVE